MTDAVQNLVAALATGQVEVVDLTQPLSEETPVLRLPEPFANTPRFRLRELSHYDERGPAWYWNAFEGGEHTGTHFDAPIHWVSGQELDDVSQVPPSRSAPRMPRASVSGASFGGGRSWFHSSSIGPGNTLTTRTPAGRISARRHCASECAAALEAEKVPCGGKLACA